jgi:uncharacterized protein YjbI with pentapeptide repeats
VALTDAHLADVILADTILANIALTDADLANAILIGAILADAILTDINITNTIFIYVTPFETLKWPCCLFYNVITIILLGQAVPCPDIGAKVLDTGPIPDARCRHALLRAYAPANFSIARD